MQAQGTACSWVEVAYRVAQQLHTGRAGTTVFTGQGGHPLLLSVARNARDADDLTRTHIQVDVLQIHPVCVECGQAQRLDLQHGCTGMALLDGQRWRLGTNHEFGQAGVALVARIHFTCHPAAAQHRTAVAQGANLVQFVADVKNAATLGGELAQRLKELLHRLRGQHRGGFVQDQELRPRHQCPHDLHPLAFANRQAINRPIWVQRQTITAGHLGNTRLHLQQRRGVSQAQPNVLGHGQGVKQAEVLEHHGQPQSAGVLRCSDGGDLPIDADFALVGPHHAVDHFHQGGLARAVFTQHSVNFTRSHLQTDLVVGQHPGVGLAQFDQFQACGLDSGGHPVVVCRC